MTKRRYISPIFLSGSTGSLGDLTGSQNGDYTDNNVFDNVSEYIQDITDANAWAWFLDKYGDDVDSWGSSIPGFSAGNEETWDVIADVIMSEYYGI